MTVLSGEHVVHFYGDDAALVEGVVRTLGATLAEGRPVVILATPAHREAMLAGFSAIGVDVDVAIASGKLVCGDAAELATRMLVDGVIDRAVFESTVARLVRRVVATHGAVSAFGEIVSVLWKDGHVVAALELESLWNELLAQVPAALLCGYSAEQVSSGDSIEAYQAVCAAHDHLVDAAPVAHDAEATRRFPGSEPALAHARRFVADTLHGWNLGHLVAASSVVVNELTTNAVQHARSEFTVSLQRAAGTVRVIVGDRLAQPPAPRTPGLGDTGGRGLLLVEALCAGWGHAEAPTGKLVWAHIGEDERAQP